MKYILVSIHKSAPTEKSGLHRQYSQLNSTNSYQQYRKYNTTIYTNKSKFIDMTLPTIQQINNTTFYRQQIRVDVSVLTTVGVSVLTIGCVGIDYRLCQY